MNDPNLYVGPSDFPFLKCPLWLNFYSILQKYNLTKHIPQSMLEAMRLDSWPKKKREDFWIYRQEVNQPRANIRNSPFDERFEAEWQHHNKLDEEIADESPHGDSSSRKLNIRR